MALHSRVVVGAILGAYIIVYGQLQSWTPQLVTGPLRQTPPNKLTEVLWGLINTGLTAAMAAAAFSLSGSEGPSQSELASLVRSSAALAIRISLW